MADPRRDFSGFYAANAERVLVYLTKRCLDPELAVDLMAETFARAFSGRRRFRGSEGAEAEGWVFAIARSVLADFWRRGKAERRALARLGIRAAPARDRRAALLGDRSPPPDLGGQRAGARVPWPAAARGLARGDPSTERSNQP
jgi:DNA-directed RNA polymerase specialized sigma24 family protein